MGITFAARRSSSRRCCFQKKFPPCSRPESRQAHNARSVPVVFDRNSGRSIACHGRQIFTRRQIHFGCAVRVALFGKKVRFFGHATARRQRMKFLLILLVRAYQVTLSPLFRGCCRFEPSCSNYAIEALQVHGAFKGSILSVCRLFRCHPFGESGYDPVPPKGSWRRVKENE